MHEKRFSVPGMHCGPCETAVRQELEAVTGVQRVDVDLETKHLSVRCENLDPTALVAAIDEAGYDADEVAA